MAKLGPKYIGINPFGSQKPLIFAILNEECNLETLDIGDIKDFISAISPFDQVSIAINGPRNNNHGLVMKELSTKGLRSGQRRGGDQRIAEKILSDSGISVSSTPQTIELCPEWMRLSFHIHSQLENVGFSRFPKEGHKKIILETHPHAIYCSMLEHKPFNKSTIEGRLQRQLLLYESKVGIHNPMKFFEEITSFKLLNGILPLDEIYSNEQLDAIAAAYTAYKAVTQPKKVTLIGSEEEGVIVLPVESFNIDLS